MLWKRKRPPEGADAAAPALAPTLEPSASSDKALDALTALLRLYGKHAFDTDTADAEEIAARCEEWATRISLGGPRPRDPPREDARARGGAELPSGSPRDASPRPPARDWPGVLGFMQEQRRAESEYVGRTLGGYRDAILSFAISLGKAIAEERESDARLDQHLGTLRRAIAARDPARVVSEAEAVASAVRAVMEQRRRREDEDVRILGEHVRELRLELSEARKKAEIDALTKLSNRAAFDEHVSHLVSLSALLGQPPWLMLVDLDHFKAINDTHGHPAGDEVLRQVSHCLSRTFLRKQDFVARYGGEEFAAVVVDTTPEQMRALAQRSMASVRELVVTHASEELRITVSLGLAALRPGEPAASWIARADAALYRAKREGRDRCEVEP